MSYSLSTKATSALGVIAIVIVLLFAIPAIGLTWGTVAVQPANTVTVYGQATSDLKNQVAVFNAGVTETNADKAVAVAAINDTMNTLLTSLKEFGIAEGDLKTQNLSVYEIEEPLFRGDQIVQQVNSVWQANNTVEIKLRDPARSSELTDLLAASGATNVYGPMFQLDVAGNPEDALIADAIENAREKAAQVAASSGQKLGGIVNVSEGGAGGSIIYPTAMMDRAQSGGGGAPTEPGTSQISKSVTVTFSLKPSWYFLPW